jgi:hypothetical protein
MSKFVKNLQRVTDLIGEWETLYYPLVSKSRNSLRTAPENAK